jgi:hypothetical protein
MAILRLQRTLEIDSNNAYYSYLFYDGNAHVTDLGVVSSVGREGQMYQNMSYACMKIGNNTH